MALLRCVLALCLFAGASALVVPSASLGRAAGSASRARCSPQMQLTDANMHRKGHVVRVEVEIEQNEPIEKALRRFRKQTNMVGHLRILRNKKTFESSHDMAIRKKKESAMRAARARRSARARM